MPSDNFVGTNNDPLSGSWTVLDGSWKLFSNSADPLDAQTSLAMWNADSFANNQYAECVINASAANGYAGVGVRLASLRGYLLLVDNGTNGWVVHRLDADETFATPLGSGAGSVTTGDVLRLEAQGTTIRAYKNSVQFGTDFTDATYGSGAAGIAGYGGEQGQLIESWTAGDLTVAATVPMPHLTESLRPFNMSSPRR